MGSKYRIAICDDISQDMENLAAMAEDALAEEGILFKLVGFGDVPSLLYRLKANPNEFDVIFMGSSFDKAEYHNISRVLRDFGARPTIVFVTATPVYNVNGFDVSAIRYLEKPVKMAKLQKILMAEYEKRSPEYIIVNGNERTRQIPVNEIYYVELKPGGAAISCVDSVIHVPGDLPELEKMLPAEIMARCHRSYIVNLQYVEAIKRYEAVLSTNIRVPVSKRYYGDMKQRLLDYVAGE